MDAGEDISYLDADEDISSVDAKDDFIPFHINEADVMGMWAQTKTYHMSQEEDNVLESSEGTDIQWSSAAKNPTVKVRLQSIRKYLAISPFKSNVLQSSEAT